jgi:hypothetical protein
VLRLVLEVIDACRPAVQLTKVATASVQRYVRAARLTGHPAHASQLRSVRVCRPTAQAFEASAVVTVNQRSRAVAARFEHQQTAWRCVALRIL